MNNTHLLSEGDQKCEEYSTTKNLCSYRIVSNEGSSSLLKRSRSVMRT